MTNTELIELLRKARGWVGHNLDCTNVCDECALAARIDAALAEHDAIPPSEDKVEWEPTCAGQSYSARIPCGTHDGQVAAVRLSEGRWVWYANAGYARGHANTLDEAQRAALSAARGMR